MIYRISDALNALLDGNTNLAEEIMIGVAKRQIDGDKRRLEDSKKFYLGDMFEDEREYWLRLAAEYEQWHKDTVDSKHLAIRCSSTSYMYSAVLALEEADLVQEEHDDSQN